MTPVAQSIVDLTRAQDERAGQCVRAPAGDPLGSETTLTKLHKAIKLGHGQGRHENYKPWNEITRSVSSPVSNLAVTPTPLYAQRSLHQLSLLERSAAQLAIWLGATEVREHLPMWPEAHAHPCDGSGTVRGLLEIAEAAGMRHPVLANSKVPSIETLDLMLQFRDGNGSYFVGWDCGPRRQGVGEVRQRNGYLMRHAYCVEVGAQAVRYVSDMVPATLLHNLDWLTPLHDELFAARRTSLLVDYAGEFLRCCDAQSLRLAQRHVARVLGLSDRKLCHSYFRMAAWTGSIDIDLSRPVLMSRPVVRDRAGVKKQLRATLASRP